MDKYPKVERLNMEFRLKLIDRSLRDRYFAAIVREIARRDLLFFVNVLGWTHDPRCVDNKEIPFITFDFQDEYLLKLNECISKGEDLFTDKSRDMGATWCILIVIFWRWLTKKNEQYRLGSRKEEGVDRPKDMSTHFEKLRWLLERMPYFLRPIGWDERKHSAYMRLYNPETRTNIVGESTNPNFGRGSRANATFLDEFASWENADEAWRSLSDATRCKLPLSTPLGLGNKFGELSRSDEIKNKFRLMWWKHPNKVGLSEYHINKVKSGKLFLWGKQVEWASDQSSAPAGCYLDVVGRIHSEWYDGECLRRKEDDIKENLDCNYLTSGNPVFDIYRCDVARRKGYPAPFVGNFIWKIRPVFDTSGVCINKDQLEVEFIESSNGIWGIWEKPESGWDQYGYCISADVSEGLIQGDYNSASVKKRFTEVFGEELVEKTVCVLHARLKAFEYAEELAKCGYYYHGACIGIEKQGHSGGAVINQIIDFYNNLYYNDLITKGYPKKGDKIGFDNANRSVKKAVIDELDKVIVEQKLHDPDIGFWDECMTFVNYDGKLEAQGKSDGQKCYDDRVMDRAIGHWMHLHLPMPRRLRKKEVSTGWRSEIQNRRGNIGWVI